MAKYDVFAIKAQQLVVVVQSDYLQPLETQLVIPLLPWTAGGRRSPRLNPIFEIEGGRYVLMPTLMAALPTKNLGAKIGTLRSEQDTIADAIDMALYGF